MILRNLSFFFMFFFLIFSVYSLGNDVWISANDVQPGVFGSDEGFGRFEFNSDLIYLGEELDHKYLNVLEPDSINSLMIINGEVKSVDIGDNEVKSIDIRDGVINSSLIRITTIKSENIRDDSLISDDFGEDVIISADIGDGEVSGIDIKDSEVDSILIPYDGVGADDVSFNYAGSNSKDGDALNSLKLLGYDWLDVPSIRVSSLFDIDYDASNNYYKLSFKNSPSYFNFLDLKYDFSIESLGNCNFLELGENYEFYPVVLRDYRKIVCGVDDVDDADNNPTNELPLGGEGIIIDGDSNGVLRVVNLDSNSVMAGGISCPNGQVLISVNGGQVTCAQPTQNTGNNNVPVISDQSSFINGDLNIVLTDGTSFLVDKKIQGAINDYCDVLDGFIVDIGYDGSITCSSDFRRVSELDVDCSSGFITGYDGVNDAVSCS